MEPGINHEQTTGRRDERKPHPWQPLSRELAKFLVAWVSNPCLRPHHGLKTRATLKVHNEGFSQGVNRLKFAARSFVGKPPLDEPTKAQNWPESFLCVLFATFASARLNPRIISITALFTALI